MDIQKDYSALERTLMASVSPYHCIIEASRQLEEAGFEKLSLTGCWKLESDHGYYLPVFDSSPCRSITIRAASPNRMEKMMIGRNCPSASA